ncbi:hypothetical protein [Phaffia rhodozyma]|uniref:Uncharacterized protein n=1 Tax=Phaffia rhodozyma TaxID=264483 RepID=A0A0F7SII0_PHARH|nr:hypothetical protein [Phaffia rhodozyma]
MKDAQNTSHTCSFERTLCSESDQLGAGCMKTPTWPRRVRDARRVSARDVNSTRSRPHRVKPGSLRVRPLFSSFPGLGERYEQDKQSFVARRAKKRVSMMLCVMVWLSHAMAREDTPKNTTPKPRGSSEERSIRTKRPEIDHQDRYAIQDQRIACYRPDGRQASKRLQKSNWARIRTIRNSNTLGRCQSPSHRFSLAFRLDERSSFLPIGYTPSFIELVEPFPSSSTPASRYPCRLFSVG